MGVLRMIFIVLIFACLGVGLFLAFFSKLLVSKKKNTEEVAARKALKIKLIGYILMMLALAFAIFQGLINE